MLVKASPSVAVNSGGVATSKSGDRIRAPAGVTVYADAMPLVTFGLIVSVPAAKKALRLVSRLYGSRSLSSCQ
jgi:hypothetical protein